MGRPSKMWYRKDRKAWFVTVNGKRHRLGKDKAKAEKKFHRLMAGDESSPQPKQNPASASDVTAAELMDKFLLWTKANRATRTFEWYTMHLQAFLDSLEDQAIHAICIRPRHVTEWVSDDWSKSYQRGAMIAVQRAFNWGVRQGYIDKSPIGSLEKPSAERRDNCPTEADYKNMLKHATGSFRDVLVLAWET